MESDCFEENRKLKTVHNIQAPQSLQLCGSDYRFTTDILWLVLVSVTDRLTPPQSQRLCGAKVLRFIKFSSVFLKNYWIAVPVN